MRRKKLGPVQYDVLYRMEQHNGGRWWNGCGWKWGGPYETAKLIDSLVPWGYVRLVGEAYPALADRTYEITAEGRIRATQPRPR